MIVFIITGVVSGVVFGAYLADIRDSTITGIQTNGPSISIVPTKSNFQQGVENVTFRVVNSGVTPLAFSDLSYNTRVTGLSGIVIYHFSEDDIVVVVVSDIPNDTVDAITPASMNSDMYDTHTKMAVNTVLDPGDGIEISWDQIKDDGDQARLGLYKIRTTGFVLPSSIVDLHMDGEKQYEYVEGYATIVLE